MLKRSKRLAVSAAASAALAFGGLAVTAPAAEAANATAGATYVCNTPLGAVPEPLRTVLGPLASFEVPATITLQNLPEVLTSNVPVPAGIPLVGTINLNGGGVFGLLQSLGITLQSTVNTVLGNVPGAGQIPINTVFTQVNGGVATLEGQLGSFVPTGSGALPIPLPTSFDFGLLSPLFNLLQVKCTLKPGTVTGGGGGGSIGVVNVVKQNSKVKAKAVNKKGHKAVVTVKVKTSAGQKAVGDVKIKARGIKAKTKALKNGKVRVVLKKLKAGKQKIRVKFLGNGFTNASKKKVNVKVVR